MEHSFEVKDFEDARDLFLLAKDRLLDVNDWNSLFQSKDYQIALTNEKGEKLHRDARVDDLVLIQATNNTGNSSDMWVRISKIQYDFFPDIRSESISMLLETSYSPSGNGVEQMNNKIETLLIKRENSTLTAHCNAGDELPDIDDETPNEHLDNTIDLHPVLSIPKEQLRQLLSGLISISEEAEH